MKLFTSLGLAVISLCISLIQEQIGRSAAIALGVKHQIVEIDQVEIIPRRKDFLTSDENPEDFCTSQETAAFPVPKELNLPGETDNKENEDENENENENENEDENESEDESEDSPMTNAKKHHLFGH